MRFQPGLCPGPRWGAHNAPKTPSWLGKGHPFHNSPHSLPRTSHSKGALIWTAFCPPCCLEPCLFIVMFSNYMFRKSVCNRYISFSSLHWCCPPDLPSFQEVRDAADELLFDKILFNNNHLLCCLLPPPSAASQTYNLRRRPHSQLQHPGHLMDSNFITRMLYKDIHWRQSINILQLTVALLPIISLYLYFFKLSILSHFI